MERRTDLALELKESFEEDNIEIKGVVVEEESLDNKLGKVTKVVIKTAAGADIMKKPIGNYITLEFDNLPDIFDFTYMDNIAGCVCNYLREILDKGNLRRILVVGLGNKDATPDSLGPETIEQIEVTRNFKEFYKGNDWEISAFIPGVMAKTGMESMEIVKGLVEEIKPDAVIAIDSLAARSTKRLNSTIQITDTGIVPGSGVGNHRKGLTKENLGCQVIAIGVPTVVDVNTIIFDVMDNMIKVFSISEEYKKLDDNEQFEFVREITSPEMKTLYVTPKDIDEDIKVLGVILSKAINNLWKNTL